MEHLCEYGCGKEAKFITRNGKYCCCKTFKQCIAIRKKRLITLENTCKIKTQKRLKEKQEYIEQQKCYICGEQAHFIKTGRYCCSTPATTCKGYKRYINEILKLKYIKHPEYREHLVEKMLEVQNRPEVKEAKSKTMIHLHREDKTFQTNYERGRDKYRELVKKLVEKNEHWKGDNNSYSSVHIRAGKLYKKKYCESCGVTHQLINHLFKTGLNLHNLNEQYNIKDADMWVTLCQYCHVQIHKLEKE